MSSSDLSSLSSPPSTDAEDEVNQAVRDGSLEHSPKNGTGTNTRRPPAQRKRPASPPHEYVLADNPDVSVCPNRSRLVSLGSYRPISHCLAVCS